MAEELFRTNLEEYQKKYESFLKFERRNNVLLVGFHTNNGPLKWGLEVHRGIIPAMRDINDDPDNEVLIITGTGDQFLGAFNRGSWSKYGFYDEFTSYHAYDLFYHDQTREPFAFLDLQIPVITAVNGPSVVHAEIALLVYRDRYTQYQLLRGALGWAGCRPRGWNSYAVARAAWSQ